MPSRAPRSSSSWCAARPRPRQGAEPRCSKRRGQSCPLAAAVQVTTFGLGGTVGKLVQALQLEMEDGDSELDSVDNLRDYWLAAGATTMGDAVTARRGRSAFPAPALALGAALKTTRRVAFRVGSV